MVWVLVPDVRGMSETPIVVFMPLVGTGVMDRVKIVLETGS